MTRCSASFSEKPRSRNTLPLDGITFSLLFAGIGPSPVHERAQAILGELQIVLRRLPRALLEGMQDTGTIMVPRYPKCEPPLKASSAVAERVMSAAAMFSR